MMKRKHNYILNLLTFNFFSYTFDLSVFNVFGFIKKINFRRLFKTKKSKNNIIIKG